MTSPRAIIPESSFAPLKTVPTRIASIAEEASEFYKALGDTTRLEILYLIFITKNSRVSANALAHSLNISAPTVTHHMKKLISAKLVTREQCGKWAYFSINSAHADTVAEIFKTR
ncbi:ArsR family transcriptional regulator [Corynebacterium deserti GIMN1.010]|uniref:ArsR family transcriptional regulator n=1 Tax=Corynebacterium deserti GIMN1.010 TaxID=931089 RepID=A0A0M5INX1_9CORY|nr:metalloregulator ArsR/SmtB family transcription factor [Corynebacterium deserti]ALC04944.1 ArsR family transcriptional regulator [Corynebacterium deserti GIMN1.010]